MCRSALKKSWSKECETLDLLTPNLEAIRQKLTQEDYDHIWAVCGDEGVGKSTFGWKVCAGIDPQFSLADVAFSVDDLFARLDIIAESGIPGRAVLYDEAMGGAYKRNAMGLDNKTLNLVAGICRGLNTALILCLPDFLDLDAFFRNRRVRVRCDITQRGEALIHTRDRNRYSGTVWWELQFRHQYGPVDATTWGAYKKAKNAYMRQAVAEARNRGTEDAESAPEAKQTKAQRLRDLAEEVAANPELWTDKGRAKTSHLMREYGLDDASAYRLARMAKAMRSVS